MPSAVDTRPSATQLRWAPGLGRRTSHLRLHRSACCQYNAPKRDRTSNLRLRRPTLYPIELWAQICSSKTIHLHRAGHTLTHGPASDNHVLKSVPQADALSPATSTTLGAGPPRCVAEIELWAQICSSKTIHLHRA